MNFEYCLDAYGAPQYMRSIAGHSDESKVTPKLFTLLAIPYELETHVYHTGSSNNYRSIFQEGLLAGDTEDRTGRQTYFFSRVHPLDNSLTEESDVPSRRPKLDTVYIFDLKIAHFRGLKFYRTRSSAIILFNIMSTKAMVKVTKIQPKQFGDRNSIRQEVLVSHRSYTYKRSSATIYCNSSVRPDTLICGTSIGGSVTWYQWTSSKLSYRLSNSRSTRTVVRQRGPGRDLIDKVEVKEQFFKHVMSCFRIPTTSKFTLRTEKPRQQTIRRSERSQLCRKARGHFKSATKRNKSSILDRYLKDERYLDNLQWDCITKEKVKEWARIASVSQQRTRSYWSRTWTLEKHVSLKKRTADGADFVSLVKYPDLSKAKEGHRQHFGRQGSNTSTQPHTFLVSDKVGVVDIILIQGRHQKDGQGRKILPKSSDRKTRTITLTPLEQRRCFGRPKAWFEGVLHGLNGWGNVFSPLSCTAHSHWHEFRFISAVHSFTQVCQTEDDWTQWDDQSHWKVTEAPSTSCKRYKHPFLSLFSVSHTKDITYSLLFCDKMYDAVVQ